MDEPSRSSSPSKAAVFARRLVSSIILWTVVLTALFSSHRELSNYVFLLVMIFLAATGLREFYGIAAKRGLLCFSTWGLIGGVSLMVGTFLNLTGVIGTSGSPARVNDFETSFLILFVLGLCLRQFFSTSNTAGILAISTTLFGLMYVPYLLNFIQKINFFPNVEGRYYLLYFILITKFSDTGAYAVGSLIGRHKMIPRISPGKTWEGVAGALAALALYAGALSQLAGMPLLSLLLMVTGLLYVSVLGDLFESWIKRVSGMKDSGDVLPGHGGVLDRIDALTSTLPIATGMLMWLERSV
jgi:phosphatidate cytidylyltransferase